MRSIIVLCGLVVMVVSNPQETYDTRYDDFDIKQLVENPRLLTAYGKCFLGKGPCTPEGSDFKEKIPDAVQTKCQKCTAKQRQLIREFIKGFQKDQPKLWEELKKKEDPKGEYNQYLEEFLKSSD